ncbi:MAG TPA: hypothetical protein VFJ85_00205 [Acidimicrobiales bacterium]|nr:hypothetical protein [Acidimicrobiales bacterium]
MNSIRKALVAAGLAGSALVGGAVGANLIGTAGAQTSATAAASTQAPAQPGPPAGFDPAKGGHVANGITETVLTGDTAEKVKAAALAAVPGGTIQRVENDAEGDAYEAHMVKSDGSLVTVKLDAGFNVTTIESGMGPR